MNLTGFYVIYDRRRELWWRADCRGYTFNLLEAGAYTEAELARANIRQGDDVVVPLGIAIEKLRLRQEGRIVLDVLVPDMASWPNEIFEPQKKKGSEP
jgi:hypothetical protein